MPEPRYDFCLAVIRKYEAGMGYTLNQVIPVYCSSIPQDDRARREWCSNRERLLQLGRTIRFAYGRPIYDRSNNHAPNDYVLWGLIPLLGTHQKIVEKVLKGFPDTGSVPCVLTQEFIVYTPGVAAWFETVCGELTKMRGGKWVIRNSSTAEVSRYCL